MIAAMPRWDLTPFFPSVDSPELAAAIAKVEEKIAQLEAKFAEPSPDVAEILGPFNGAGEELSLMQGYLYALVTTDSNDDKALAKDSELEAIGTRFRKLAVQLTSLAGSLDSMPSGAEGHAFFFERARVLAKHQMTPAEEALAADLAPTGWIAWSKLHGNFGSKIEATVELPEGAKELPISAIRNLAFDEREEVRRMAFHAEIGAFKRAEVPLAASLNGVKGMVSVLGARRGWASPLQEAAFANFLDEATLDAMLSAARESFPDFRRYLKAKAKLLGKQKLPFYDLFAPVGAESREWTVEQAESFVQDNFGTFGPRMAGLAERSFKESWIDYEPRTGKRDGAYCCPFGSGISRILMNWKPSYKSVSTLAHELGHAYHNVCLSERTYLQRDIPSTLAETASIFCETIVKNAVLKTVEGQERLSILEATLSGACQVVVDISSRFLFEKAVFDQRASRELSPNEFCELMAQAQRDTYGDGLDEAFLHPYMWAAKPHYYDAGSFYNFPYMFGLLFAIGLSSVYESEPNGFVERYDDLLSSCGMADAATLAGRFGIDIAKPDFWKSSLGVLKRDIDAFEAMV